MDEHKSGVAVQPETTQKKPGGCTGKGFVKGDKRINRKGRPRSFDALRKLAQEIACRPLRESEYTRAEAILVKWSTGDFQEQKAFLEIGYGKVPDDTNLNITGEVRQNIFNYAAIDGLLATRPTGDSSQPSPDQGRDGGA